MVSVLLGLWAGAAWSQAPGEQPAAAEPDAAEAAGADDAAPAPAETAEAAEEPPPLESLPGMESPRERARRHFVLGNQLVRRQHWQAALAEFDESLRHYHSQSALFNRALCLYHLYEYPEAIAAFRSFMARYGDDVDAEQRAEVERFVAEMRDLLTAVTIEVNEQGAVVRVDNEVAGITPLREPLLLLSGPHSVEVSREGFGTLRRELAVVAGRAMTEVFELVPRARLGRLRIECNVADAQVVIDGHEVGTIPYQGVLVEGDHQIEVRAEGYEPSEQTVTITAGEDRIATVALSRPRFGVHRAVFWSAIGLTAASSLTTLILGITTYRLDQDYDPDAADADERYAQGRGMVLGTDAALGIALVAGAAAFVLSFFTDWGVVQPDTEGGEERESAYVVPAPLGRGGWGLALGWRR